MSWELIAVVIAIVAIPSAVLVYLATKVGVKADPEPHRQEVIERLKRLSAKKDSWLTRSH